MVRQNGTNALAIGWASRDVSTDQPIDIPGQFHIRVSKGVLDPITVTALVIESGADIVMFVSADFVAIRPCLLNAVRARVAKLLPAVPVDKIVMNATHTHAGASYYETRSAVMSSPDQVPHEGVEIASSDDYREFLVARITEAVSEAYTKRAPGGIAYGYGYGVAGHSRRTVYFDDPSQRPEHAGKPGMMVDGHARMYGNTQDERFSHYEAGADPFVNLLYTFDPAGKLTGAVVNVPCPSQNSEHEWRLSADYWHDARVAIRRRRGDIYLLSQCAAAGDLSPRLLHYQKAQERRFRLKYGPAERKDMAERKDIAERLAGAFDDVLAWAGKDIQTAVPLTHVVDTVHLDRRLVTTDEAAYEAEQLEKLKREPFKTEGTPTDRLVHNSTLVSRRNRCALILDRYEKQKTEPTFPMELHVIRLGDVAFATNCFEMFMDYMHRIQARSPFVQTFVVQLTGSPGGSGGYLATERGAWGKGYSASLYCNQVSPRGGQELVEATLKTLKAIYTPDAG